MTTSSNTVPSSASEHNIHTPEMDTTSSNTAPSSSSEQNTVTPEMDKDDALYSSEKSNYFFEPDLVYYRMR